MDTQKSLQSVWAQTDQNYEIILVDNGSDDRSVEIFQNQTLCQTRLCISDYNRGFGGGVNFAISQLDLFPGDFVLLLNNDAELAPDALENLHGMMRENPDIGAMGGIILNDHNDDIQIPGGGNISLWSGSSQRRASRPAPDFISGALMLIRADLLRQGIRFSEAYFMYWEDVDFSYQVRQAGWHIGVCDTAHARHKAMASLGKDSPAYDRYFTWGATVFFSRWYGILGWFPILMIAMKKLVKRTLRGPWANIGAVLSGLRQGMRAPHA